MSAFDLLSADGRKVALAEIMGDFDEVDVFFVLDFVAGQVVVLRVTGLPESGQAWVH